MPNQGQQRARIKQRGDGLYDVDVQGVNGDVVGVTLEGAINFCEKEGITYGVVGHKNHTSDHGVKRGLAEVGLEDCAACRVAMNELLEEHRRDVLTTHLGVHGKP